MPSHPLDNPAWGALAGRHSPLAVKSGRFLQYRADVSVFAATAAPEAGLGGLADALVPGAITAVVTAKPVAVPADLEIVEAMRAPQMVMDRPLPEHDAGTRPLTDADVPAMLELTALTRPGPFLPRTIEMGRYVGIFDGARLVAMAGERLQPPGHTEISAVCTHPDYQGRGYARALMAEVARGIVARGETPFLHVRSDNTGALALYTALGFKTRHEVTFTILRRKTAV